MAHPYNNDREDKVMKRRVSSIAGVNAGPPKSYCSGGTAVKGYAAGGAVEGPVRGEIATRAGGGKVKARGDRPNRAKGGRVKGFGGKAKGHKTNVNVIVAPSGGPQAGLGPKPPMPMPPPPAAPPALPPMAAKPPMPGMPPGPGAPGMGGPPMPMRKRGGRVNDHDADDKKRARGGKVDAADQKGVTGIGDRTPVQHSGNKSDTQNIGRKQVVTYATGGPVEAGKGMGPKLPGGGRGGSARLAKARRYAGKGGLAQKNVGAAERSGQKGL